MVFRDDGIWLLFPLDKTQHIRIVSPEVWVLELVGLYFRIALQDALLEMLNLVETVHIQLPDETGELLKGQGDVESRKPMRMQSTSRRLGLHCCV